MEIDLQKESNLNAIIYDVLQGDSSLMDTLSVYSDVELNKVMKALDFIISNESLSVREKTDLLANSWRINYKIKPPSPEEFLGEKYLGEANSNSIYPRIRKAFLEFADPQNYYRNAVLYPHISYGKSYLSVLWNLYTTTHLAMMRDAKKYFGLSPSVVLCQVFCSFNLKKSAEVLTEPFINMLEKAEFYEKVRTRDDMIKKELEFSKTNQIDKLYWTTASRNGVSALQFSNGINYKMASSPNAILGITIVSAVLSELAFFRDGGKSDEWILRFYNDTKSRVFSRMKDKNDPTGINYWGRTILDSSPNDIESPIDQYCLFDAKKDPKNYVVSGASWKFTPEDFRDVNDTFPIFKGGSGKPPKILTSTEGYDHTDIVEVPKELYQFFADDLRKSLKDLAGIPQGSQDKIFNDYDKIEQVFIPQMKSINYCIKADAKMSPHDLIWNQVKNEFFVKSGFGWQFWYKPSIPRVVSIDQSVVSDMSCIAITHIERKSRELGDGSFEVDRDVVYVCDLLIPIHPLGGRINLDAIKEFILDLRTKGQMPIIAVSYDQYQSTSALQHLERQGIEPEKISVDETMDPYLYLAQVIEQGNLKTGRNIFLKNNLKSLQITKRPRTNTLKIDHTAGDSPDPNTADYNWTSSLLGINAKDCSDALAASIDLARRKLATDGRNLLQEWNESKIITTPEMAMQQTQGFLKKIGFSM